MMLCSETLSITSFHYVQVNLQTYYDMMMMMVVVVVVVVMMM